MRSKQILVLGGGFAGLWSAVGAARKLDELGQCPDAGRVTLINRDIFRDLRALIDDSSPLVSAIPSAELVELMRRLKRFFKRIHATT
jgi:NADH:ubiquinone reductase (H+-translocating)